MNTVNSFDNNNYKKWITGSETKHNEQNYENGTKESTEALTETTPVKREKWGSTVEFILSCVGWSVGFGNVWRFPYLAYSNGGGAFLLPYVILLILIGKPMYFLEVALGQFGSLGPTSIWKCFPIAKGVGVAMVITCLVVSINYNVLMAYNLYFMAQSFRSVIPWSGCFEWWGADSSCFVRTVNRTSCKDTEQNIEITGTMKNLTEWGNFTGASQICQTASEQFWERYVLRMSPSINEMGSINWQLALCLLASWVLIYSCMSNGLKTSGKVVYFTATFPYVILISLLIYGLTLSGAKDGLKYFFLPKWEKLTDIQVWFAAAEQLFYSLGLAWGGLIMFGSYNEFHVKVHRYALFVTSIDFITSLMAGTVVFSVLGKMSKEVGVPIESVVKADQRLAFVAYPEALAGLWAPQLWTFLFFMMMLLLGVDSEFALLETVVAAIWDEFPKTRKYKPFITIFLCISCFLLGIPCIMQGGTYVFNIMDRYGGGFGLLFMAICELLALMWGYGIRRICSDFGMMLNIKVNYYFQSSWLVISPLVLAFIFIYAMCTRERMSYNGQPYPDWAEGVGWFLALISLIQIPVWAIAILIKNRKNLRRAIYPTDDWGPEDLDNRKKWIEKNKELPLKHLRGIDNYGFDIGQSESHL